MKTEEECIYCSLTFAVHNKDIDKVKAIVASGIDLNKQIVCNDALDLAIKENDSELVDLLISNGANPNVKLDINDLPIVQAIKNRNTTIINLLISFGASLDDFPITDYVGQSDNVELLEFLLNIGLSVNFIDEKTGRNSLHIAAMYGYLDSVNFLLKKGSVKDIKDKWGNTAYDLACTNNHKRIIEVFNKTE